MRIISKTALELFWQTHPEAESKLTAWYAALKHCSASDYNELKQTFSTADYVPKKYTVFDVGGNAYRVIVSIHYNTQIAYIREVLTHAEYNKWTRANRGK
jgi:mRNA interferase HigB